MRPQSASARASVMLTVNSDFRSAAKSPCAQRTPGLGGTRMRDMPSSSARAQPWSGPAPPKGTSVKSRGSCPRSTETTRIAPTMLLLAMARMPLAASSRLSFKGRAMRSIAARAKCASSFIRPPSKVSGKWPNTRCASVTVAAVPPRP